MGLIIYGLIGMVLLFGFVVAFGAPYLPTLKKQTDEALDLLALKPGQTVLELGSGDGRVMLAAAKQGLNVVGYELNPILALVSRIVTWRYRKQVKVVWGNFWHKKWPPADGIFVFLLDRYMVKLDQAITGYQQKQTKPVRLVSFTFAIPHKKPAKTIGGLLRYDYK